MDSDRLYQIAGEVERGCTNKEELKLSMHIREVAKLAFRREFKDFILKVHGLSSLSRESMKQCLQNQKEV